MSKKKRIALFLVIAAVLLLALAVALVVLQKTPEPPVVEEPCFSLNGADYPSNLTLRDFLDRGWKASDSYSYQGGWDEVSGQPVDTYISGCRLKDGEKTIFVYFNDEDRKKGLDLEVSRVSGISLYGDKVDSFYFADIDISKVTLEQITVAFGEADQIDEPRNYFYTSIAREYGLSEIMFSFSGSSSPVGQIYISM